MILRRQFETKENVSLESTKYSPSSLSFPCMINIKEASNDSLMEVLKSCENLGAVTLFEQPYCNDNMLHEVALMREEINKYGNYGFMALIYLRFNNSGKLRLSLSHKIAESSAVYPVDMFLELSTNLKDPLPLKV